MALHTRVILLLPFVLLASAPAQSVAPTLGESVKPVATLDRNIFKAGEDISITVGLGVPAPRDMQVHTQVYCAGTYLTFAGPARKGDTSVVVKTGTDSLLPDAKCTISEFQIDPPPHVDGQTNVVTATTIRLPSPVNFEISGVPHVAETLDMKVTAEVNLSERQFLRSRAVAVRSYRQDILSYLEKNANETPAYYNFLLHTLTDARDELLRTRQVFVIRYRPNGDHPPYFDDLQRRYDALISDILRRGGKLARLESKPKFVTVQVLLHRPPPSEDDSQSSNFSGTYPPDANEALDIVNWNVGVYLDIANNGKDVFELTIASWPADATVSSKRIGEEYTVLGQKTTISKAKFPFALWMFKFTKPGCKDYFQTFDPVHDTSPNLDVELECGR